MSNLILPPGVRSVSDNANDAPEQENIPIEDRAKQLPDPKGWMILAAVVESSDNFDNSVLVKSDITKRIDEQTSPILFVMKLGPEAYIDKTKFPSGPRCAEGDFILTRPYAGTRVKIHGKEFRLLNDDQVEATVQDPRGISRA